MKKLNLAVILLFFVFASCTGDCPDCKSAAAANESTAITGITDLADLAWNQRDIPTFLTSLSDDFVRTENGKVVVNNKGEMEAAMNVFFTAFPDMKLTITNTHVGSSTIVNEWSVTGTQTGPFGDIPATGKQATFVGASTITFSDAQQITREDVYFDVLSLMTQLGYTLAPTAEEATAM